MPVFAFTFSRVLFFTGFILWILSSFSSCLVVKNKPVNRPYLYKNKIEVTGGNFSRQEKAALENRMENQLDDSAKVDISSPYFFRNVIKTPTAYDTGYSVASLANMKASMFHLGYYNAKTSFVADTSGRKVTVTYYVNTGKPTLIDTVSYRMQLPELQQLAESIKKGSILKENLPVTKAGIQSEIARLVDSFRNNGYYKFTGSELKVLGDTTLAALTSITDDPFEQLRLLAEAQQKRDSPTIKLAVILNNPQDASHLNQYRIRNIYILPDFRQGDYGIGTNLTEERTRYFTQRYHTKLFNTSFLTRNLSFRPGDIYRQSDYFKTLGKYATAGVWDNVNIQVVEIPDSNMVDLFIEMSPAKKFGIETALEASYSTTNSSNALAGNLFGLSGNFTLTNRNIGREAIRMTHRLRAGVELNNNSRGGQYKLVNSNEISYSNNVVLPRLLFGKKYFPTGETFLNTSYAYSNRLQLFNLQTFNLNFGINATGKKNRRYIIKLFTAEFNNLFNETDSFKNILNQNPFLRYSFNTAYVVGTAGSYSSIYRNPRHLKSEYKERGFKLNLEESGLTWANLGIAKKYLRKFVKADIEYKYTVDYKKTGLAFRLFTGVGVPLGKDTNTTLPFFKAYFGGGSNSMRGWPIRGIGPGAKARTPYSNTLFSESLGDIQIEGNAEYRYEIARIIPNTLTLRGAVFVDAGNVWNFKNSNADRSRDSAQFHFKNLYKELGLSAGTGFRFDFNYLILRIDLGFRFKRPELSEINDGWKAPPIGFDDFFKKIFTRGINDEYRRWRYDNFNFTIGINYPF